MKTQRKTVVLYKGNQGHLMEDYDEGPQIYI